MTMSTKEMQRMHWLLNHNRFEESHDGVGPLYRAPGQLIWHSEKMDAVDAAVYAEGLRSVMADRRVR